MISSLLFGKGIEPASESLIARPSLQELSEHVLVIPSLPEIFTTVRHKALKTHSATLQTADYGKIYSSHAVGSKMMSEHGQDVISPMRGVFYGSAYVHQPQRWAELEEELSLGRFSKDGQQKALALFRPLKEYDVGAHTSQAYTTLADIEQYIAGRKLPSGLGNKAEVLAKLQAAFNVVQTQDLPRISMDKKPALQAGLKSDSFASNYDRDYFS